MMKKALSFLLFLLMVFPMVSAYAQTQDISPEDRAEPGTLPALLWGEAGVDAKEWIDAFVSYINAKGIDRGLNGEDFRTRAYGADNKLFRSARLNHLEAIVGIRSGEVPLLIGLAMYPLPELGNMPASQHKKALYDYSIAINACIYANIKTLGMVYTELAADIGKSMYPFDLEEIAALGEDVEVYMSMPSHRGITTEYYLRYDADIMFLTFGFDYMEGPMEQPPAAGQGIPLLEYLNNPVLTAFAENFDKDFPVSVSVRYEGEVGGNPVTITDPEVIRAVFEALQGITVMAERPENGSRHDTLRYYFRMADGRDIYNFTFQKDFLLDSRMSLHDILGFDALKAILPDPGYNQQ